MYLYLNPLLFLQLEALLKLANAVPISMGAHALHLRQALCPCQDMDAFLLDSMFKSL